MRFRKLTKINDFFGLEVLKIRIGAFDGGNGKKFNRRRMLSATGARIMVSNTGTEFNESDYLKRIDLEGDIFEIKKDGMTNAERQITTVSTFNPITIHPFMAIGTVFK